MIRRKLKKIKVNEFLKQNKYLYKLNEINSDIQFETTEIYRPALAFYSKFKYSSRGGVQIIGNQEFEFLDKLNVDDINNFFAEGLSLVIFARDKQPSEEFLKVAKEYDILVCKSTLATSKVFSKVHKFLEMFLAEETQLHGVMLSISGKGTLIKGASGVGKSEVALELIKRGHLLISDDQIIVKKLDNDTLSCEPPEILRNKMEIRGIGIVDIQKLFGVTSVSLSKEIDLIIELTDKAEAVDRIGNAYLYETILGVKKKKITIPILSGKNIANLVEVAVANYQLAEDYNYNSSEEFIELLNETLKNKKNKKGMEG